MALLLGGRRSAFRLELSEVLIETIEALLPEPPVARRKGGNLTQGAGVELARAVLRLPAARDEACMLEHAQVLRDGGAAHVERRREFRDGGWSRRETREDRAPGGIGERREGRAETVLMGLHLTAWLDNHKVRCARRQAA